MQWDIIQSWKKGHPSTCDNTDGSWACYAKKDRKGQVLYASTYMWTLKKAKLVKRESKMIAMSNKRGRIAHTFKLQTCMESKISPIDLMQSIMNIVNSIVFSHQAC